MTDKESIEEQLIEASNQSAANMGAAQDLFVQDVGWVLRDGEITEIGILFFEKIYGDKK